MRVLMINCKSTLPGLYKEHFYDVLYYNFICSCISNFHSYHDHFSVKDVNNYKYKLSACTVKSKVSIPN